MWINRRVVEGMIRASRVGRRGTRPRHLDHEAGHGGQQSKPDGIDEQAATLGRQFPNQPTPLGSGSFHPRQAVKPAAGSPAGAPRARVRPTPATNRSRSASARSSRTRLRTTRVGNSHDGFASRHVNSQRGRQSILDAEVDQGLARTAPVSELSQPGRAGGSKSAKARPEL
jgi:hypothetical protein